MLVPMLDSSEMQLDLQKRPRFTKHVSVFLTEAQHSLLLEYASAKDTTLSEVLRAIINVACTSILNEEKK